MLDLVFVGAAVLFFAVSLVYVWACDKGIGRA